MWDEEDLVQADEAYDRRIETLAEEEMKKSQPKETSNVSHSTPS